MIALSASGSHTTTAASAPMSALAPSCQNSMEPGQSRNVKASSRVSGRRDVELRAHLPVACLGARVTDGVAFLRAPLSVDRSRGEQDRLEKCCFSRGIWTDKRYGSRSGISTPAHRSCLDVAVPTPTEIPSPIQRPKRHDVLPWSTMFSSGCPACKRKTAVGSPADDVSGLGSTRED